MKLGQNGVLRYGHFGEFLEFFEDRMANLGLIDFKLGLYIKVNVNTNLKFISLTISQNGHQLAQIRPDDTFGQENLLGITR